MSLLASCTLVMGAPVLRKFLVVPESKMAHLLMVSMSILTVQRRVVAAKRERNIFCLRFILLVSSIPACQKLLYQP